MGREGYARARILQSLTHIYTRQRQVERPDNPVTTAVDEAHDVWGDVIVDYPPADVASGLPCSYAERPELIRTGDATLLVRVPTLTVPYDDSIMPGDEVLDVRTRDGMLLLTGPALVERVVPVAPSGPVIQKNARLRAVEAQA